MDNQNNDAQNVSNVQPEVAPVQPEAAPVEQPATPVSVVTPEPSVQPSAPTNTIPDPIGGNVGGVVPGGPSYMSAGEPIGQKKSKKGLIIAALVVIVLGVVGYFVVWPMFNKKMSPAEVYTTSIDNLSKNINSTLEVVNKERMTIDGSIELDTDEPSLEVFNGKYTLRMGIDPANKVLEAGASSNDIGGTIITEGDEIYLKLSTNDDLIYIGQLEGEEFASFEEMFNEFAAILNGEVGVSVEDVQYLVTKTLTLFKENIDTSKITTEKTTIKLNGEELKVTANTYELDAKGITTLLKNVLNGLVDDKESNEILSTLLGEDYEYFKDSIDEIDAGEALGENVKFKTTIYIYGKDSTTVGYEFKVGDESFKYYTKDGNFEVSYNSTSSIKIIGKKEGNKTNVEVKAEDQKIASFVVNSWTDEKIDLTYDIMGMVTGSLVITDKETSEKETIDVDFKINYDSYYINIKMNWIIDWTSDLPSINTKTAKEYSDEEKKELIDEFYEKFIETPIGKIYLGTMSEDYIDYDDDDWYNEEDYDWDIANDISDYDDEEDIW